MPSYICSGRRVDNADKAEIRRLHGQGMDSRTISERLGIGRKTITTVLAKHRAAALERAQLATGD